MGRLLVLWSAVCLSSLTAQSASGGAVHFSDAMNGRLAWVVEDHMLPWTGAFNYLSSLKDRTALLTVADSSTGIPLGECSTNSFGDKWESFSWSLSATDLLCTVSQTNSSRVRFVPTHSDAPRSFSVRIQASRGPRCMSSIVVEGAQPTGCPPVLSSHGFSQMSLQCGCPYAQEPTVPLSAARPVQQLQPAVLPFLPRAPFHTFLPSSSPAPALAPTPAFPRVHLGAAGPEESSPFVPPAVVAAPTPAAVHPCSTHVCSNGGRCTVNDAGFAECACLDGFAGRHCENDVCAQVPCGNGGRCSAKGTIATCHCPKHTRGLLCEEVVCPTPCANGGNCQLDRAGEAICDCPEGFTGPNCNVVDVCLGNAACSLYGPSAVCHIDEEATIAPRERLMRETPFECKCPLAGSIEWVDCISLHVPSTASVAPTTTTALPTVPFSFSFSSPTPAVVIPPLAPHTPHPGMPVITESTGFQPNPNQSSFNARPVPAATTASPGPSVPIVPNPHQFTFQTVIPPMGAGEVTTVRPQQPAVELLPFNPPFFPAPATAAATTQASSQGQQVHITLPPTTVNVQGGNSEEDRREALESTTPEGVAVPAAAIPVVPVLLPHGHQQLPSTTTAAPFVPLMPHFPASSTGHSTTVFPQETGAAIDAVEVTTTPQETTTDFPTTTAPFVQPGEERGGDPFESSSGSGFVASTMETTVEELATVATTERSTVEQTTVVEEVEEETETPTTETFVAPVEEEKEEELETPVPFFPRTEPTWTMPTTTTTTTSTTTPSTTTTSVYEPPQTPSVFSRPRVPQTGTTNNMIGGSTSPFDSSPTSRGSSSSHAGAASANSATASWIVGIVAVAVLGLMLLAIALGVLRYVRQSRKLHGKYNPAREEHALSSAYAMPMATVTKEERLI